MFKDAMNADCAFHQWRVFFMNGGHSVYAEMSLISAMDWHPNRFGPLHEFLARGWD
jgi:hypothetical protein